MLLLLLLMPCSNATEGRWEDLPKIQKGEKEGKKKQKKRPEVGRNEAYLHPETAHRLRAVNKRHHHRVSLDGDRAADDDFLVQLVLPILVFTVIHLFFHVRIVVILWERR